MRKPKIYLETTLFNFYVDQERDAHADTVRLFEDIAAGKYEAYTSLLNARQSSARAASMCCTTIVPLKSTPPWR